MSDNVHVAIRVRPLIDREKNEDSYIAWQVHGNNHINQLDRKGCVAGSSFTFDRIFPMESSNREVYEQMCHSIVESAIEGFHGTIFAYGQTSSGKTYTMMGNKLEKGVISMTIEDIFDMCLKKTSRQFRFWVSYMEIYNEKISDLILNNSGLIIKENTDGHVFVNDLEEIPVKSVDEVLRVMAKAEKNRRFGGTAMNEHSSRSHTIFKMLVESKMRGSGDDAPVKVSQLNLVDLAGSEKAGQMGSTGDRFKEGVHINKSLLTLSQVISNLSEGKFVNYRDSKLTRILQNSLGGNSRTSIICTVTPAVVDQTLSTLNFACRAKRIQNKPVINEVLSDAALLRISRRKIAALEEYIATLEEGNHHKDESSPKKEVLLNQRSCIRESGALSKSTVKEEISQRQTRNFALSEAASNFAIFSPGLASISERSSMEQYFEAQYLQSVKEELQEMDQEDVFNDRNVTKRRKTKMLSQDQFDDIFMSPSQRKMSFLTTGYHLLQVSPDKNELKETISELKAKVQELEQVIEALRNGVKRDSFLDKELKYSSEMETTVHQAETVNILEETAKDLRTELQELNEREVNLNGTCFGKSITFSPFAQKQSVVKFSTSCQTEDAIVPSFNLNTSNIDICHAVGADELGRTILNTSPTHVWNTEATTQVDENCSLEFKKTNWSSTIKQYSDGFVQTEDKVNVLCACNVLKLMAETQTVQPFKCNLHTQTEPEPIVQLKLHNISLQTELINEHAHTQTEVFTTACVSLQTTLPVVSDSSTQTGRINVSDAAVQIKDYVKLKVDASIQTTEHFSSQTLNRTTLDCSVQFVASNPSETVEDSETLRKKINELNETNLELEEEIQHWKGELATCHDIIYEELQKSQFHESQDHKTQEEVSVLKENNLELEDEIEHWKQELEMYKELLDKEQEKCTALQASVSEKQEEANVLKENISELKDATKNLQEKQDYFKELLNEEQKKLEDLQVLNVENEEEVFTQKETILELEEEITHWKRELEDLKNLFYAQQEKFQDLQTKNVEKQNERCSQETILELEDEVKHWKSELANIKELLDIEQNKNKCHPDFDKKLSELSSENASLHLSKNLLEEKVGSLQCKTEALQLDIKNLLEDKTNCDEEMASMQLQVIKSKNLVEESCKESDLMSKELTTLYQKFSASESALKEAIKESAMHKSNCFELQVDYKRLLKTIDDLEKKVDFYQKKADETQNKLRKASLSQMDNTVVHLRTPDPPVSQAIATTDQQAKPYITGGYVAKFRIITLERELHDLKKKQIRLIRAFKGCRCTTSGNSADFKENVEPSPDADISSASTHSSVSQSSQETRRTVSAALKDTNETLPTVSSSRQNAIFSLSQNVEADKTPSSSCALRSNLGETNVDQHQGNFSQPRSSVVSKKQRPAYQRPAAPKYPSPTRPQDFMEDFTLELNKPYKPKRYGDEDPDCTTQ